MTVQESEEERKFNLHFHTLFQILLKLFQWISIVVAFCKTARFNLIFVKVKQEQIIGPTGVLIIDGSASEGCLGSSKRKEKKFNEIIFSVSTF